MAGNRRGFLNNPQYSDAMLDNAARFRILRENKFAP